MNATARILSATIATVLLAALPAPRPVQASPVLQHCTTADGNDIYTDKPCSAFGADSVPMPAAMMTRLASTFPKEAHGNQADAMNVASTTPVSRRSAASGCARTPQQLETDLRGSLALGDVNQIAESYHWVGLNSDDSKRLLARLQTMADRQVRDTHYFNARITSTHGDLYADASGTAPEATGSAGVMQVQLGTASSIQVVDMPVERYSGCYFVHF